MYYNSEEEISETPDYQKILQWIKDAKILTSEEKKTLAKQRAELSPNLAEDLKKIRKLWKRGLISPEEYFSRETYLRLMLSRQYTFKRWQWMVEKYLKRYYGE